MTGQTAYYVSYGRFLDKYYVDGLEDAKTKLEMRLATGGVSGAGDGGSLVEDRMGRA